MNMLNVTASKTIIEFKQSDNFDWCLYKVNNS